MEFDERFKRDGKFQRLDINENSRSMTTDNREVDGKMDEEVSTISTFTMDLPAPLKKVQTSSASGKQTQPDLPPLMSGIDDTLNNDFFYDEEFAIPFDANLVEDCRSLPAELDSLMRKMFPPPGAGDGNLGWQHPKMVLSKSDSCLYQADQELSDSEREMSMSDHESSSSSNNSPLQGNQSLFSSGGEPGCDDVSSVCRAEISDSATSGSLSRDTDKYDYDWSEGKRRYVLMFDRSPTKTCSSEEESCQQRTDSKARIKITSWLRTRPAKPRRKNEEPSHNLSQITKTGKEKRTDSGLTTWGQVKNQQQCSSGNVRGNGLTTWQQVKESPPSSFRDALAVARNVARKEEKRMDTVLEELSSPPGRTIDTAVEVKISQDDVCHSRKLFDFYCKLKLQEEMTEFVKNEGLASPLSGEKLVDPWSESLITGGSPGKVVEVIHDNPIPPEKCTWSDVDDAGKRKPNGRIPNDVAPAVDDFAGGVAAVSSDRNTNAEQAGSPVLTASLLRRHDTVDCSIQFPPASMDCSVQTSFQFSSSNQSSVTESKAQQTSPVASVTSLQNIPTGGFANSIRVKNKMAHSAHLLSRPLPDLSFLNKPANQQLRKTDDVRPARREVGRGDSQNVNQTCDASSGHEENAGSKTIRLRSTDAKTSSSSDSRESSPNPVLFRNRSRSSDSTYSICSTSSSGIDPGFCDSSGSSTRTPRHSRIFDEVIRDAPNVHAPEPSKIPPKPPRIFAADPEILRQNQTNDETKPETEGRNEEDDDDDSNVVVSVCNVCNSQILSGKVNARNLANSHPTYDRETQGRSSSTQQFDYLHISPTHSRAPRGLCDSSQSVARRPNHDSLTHRHGSPRLSRGKDHVILRGNQPQTAKPAKSILVRRRQRNQSKYRSWSNPSCDFDDLGSSRGRLPSYLVGEGRPLSLPDENLLHLGPSGVLEEQDEGLATCAPEDDDESKNETQVAEDGEDDEENEIEDGECDYERFKAKKSVSFSEKIFYHSTSAAASPLDSPKCTQALIKSPVLAAASTSLAIPKRSAECKSLAKLNDFKTDSDDSELPPTDFIVSPNMSPSSSLSSSDVSLSTDILHKRELVFDVMRAVEVLVKYFSQTRDAAKKVQLGSTLESADVGRLVLEHLCPAIHAVILDGIKPHVNSLFGKVKNSAYKVMEDSAELGQPVELIQDLVKSLKSLKFLRTPWVIFNAFIFGLLNYKALDFWLTFIHNHKLLVAKHYTSFGFLHLGNPSTHRLFLDMITSLQPLAQMPFRLEYGFETRMLERRRQDQLADHLLDRHVSRSVETYVEGQQFLAQLHNVSSSQHALQRDDGIVTATESKMKQRTRNLWEETQRQLVVKLSHGRELLTSESTALVRSVARAASVGRPRPLSFPGTGQGGASNYVNFSPAVNSVRSLPRGESSELMEGGSEGCLVESSGSEEDGDGVLVRMAKQLKEMNLKGKVYRRGATGYSFEEMFPPSSSSPKTINARDENSTMKAGARPDRNTTTEFKSDVVTSNLDQMTSMIPRSDVRSDSDGIKSPPSSAALTDDADNRMSSETASANSIPGVRTSAASSAWTNPAKLLSSLRNSMESTFSSDAAASFVGSMKSSSRGSTPSSPSVRLTDSSRLGASVSRKRWSDIGSHLVNIFDRLLLSDSKVTVSAPSPASPPSVVKCSSVGQISATSLNDVIGSKVRRLSSSAGGNHFERALNLDSVRNQSKATNSESAVSKHRRRALTLCHYIATDNRQLSFEKGTSVVVLQDCNSEWKLCRLGQTVGLVHNACIRPDDDTAGNSPPK